MSKKSTIARCAGTAAAVAGTIALVAPGIASAEPTAAVPAPKVSAGVDGDVIDMTVTQTSTGQNAFCLPIVLNATDAAPVADSSTALDENDFNPGLLKPITPGAYAVVGACFDKDAQDAVLSYSYQVVFSPGGFGSLGQALDLGSATINMDGGSAVIADLLKSGAGSSMLFANLS